VSSDTVLGALVLGLALGFFAPTACSSVPTPPPHTAEAVLDDAARVANAAALAIETAQRAAELTYYATQKRTVDRSIAGRWSGDKYQAAIRQVRADWDPVWAAFEKVRHSHRVLTDAILDGADALQIASLAAVFAQDRSTLTKALGAPERLGHK